MVSKYKELEALISLLDEPDNSIFVKIRQEIIMHGPDAIPVLESAWNNSFSDLLQARISDIIHIIRLQRIQDKLIRWKNTKDDDLLTAMILISNYQYPELDELSLRDKLENIRKDIWIEINENLTALEKIKVVNHILFEIHNFSGSKDNFNKPENYFLNDILNNKKGSPVALGMLYIYLTRSVGMPVFGVDLPQHFILAYIDEIEDERIKAFDEKVVLFYVNPFNNGAVFTKREIELFLKQLKLKSKPSYFLPCDNHTIFKRLIQNLRFVYKKNGEIKKDDELKEFEKIF